MIKKNALRYLVLLLVGALMPLSYAERNDLEEIVVIGSEDEIVRVPGSGALLTEDDLERFDYVDLHQTLSSIPGVYVREEDGFGLRPNIGIRGATPDRSQKITILEDGILITPAPYSAPAAYYVPNISRMENVEVLKGPSAISQGPHTVAGAINFVTKPLEETSNQIDVSFGSDEYYKVQGLLSGVEERTAWQLDLNSFGSSGFKDLDSGGDTGFVRSEANLKIQHDFDSDREQRIVFKLGWADEDADETYLGLTDADFALEPTRRYRASQLANFDTDHITMHLNHGVRFSEKLSLNTKVYWHEFNRAWKKLDGFIDGPPLQRVLTSPNLFTNEYLLLKGERDSDRSDRDTLDVTMSDRSFNSMGVQVTAKYELSTGPIDHQIAAGFRYHYDEVDRDHRQEGYFMVSGLMVSDEQNRGSKVQNHAETDAYSLFVSDQISFGQFTVTLGIRH
jgi:Fe(3+) dicitrate transport protein